MSIEYCEPSGDPKKWEYRYAKYAVYVMKDLREPRLYRVGAIGINAKHNTVLKRLQQVKAGARNKHTWEYLCIGLIADGALEDILHYYVYTVEVHLHSAMLDRFASKRQSQFLAKNDGEVKSLFKECLNKFQSSDLISRLRIACK